jgi:hypothetical protein
MVAYLVNHTKKKRIFRKREEELRHAVRHNFSRAKIEKAAEKLRGAKFAVFKAKFSQFSVLPAHAFSLDDLAEEKPFVKRWVSMSVDEIIAEYSECAT